MFLHAKTKLLLTRHNPEHFGVALFASTGHCLPLPAPFSFKRGLVGIFHHSFGLALNAICFLSHVFIFNVNMRSLAYLFVNSNRVWITVWAREGSNLRPLSYQDSVLPLNYVPEFLEYLKLYTALKIKIKVITVAEVKQ